MFLNNISEKSRSFIINEKRFKCELGKNLIVHKVSCKIIQSSNHYLISRMKKVDFSREFIFANLEKNQFFRENLIPEILG